MEKYAWKAIIVEGKLEEYKHRHDNLWDEVKEVLKEAGICNYTIWNVEMNYSVIMNVNSE